MNYQQLSAFAKVCALDLNVSRAAEALLTSQPALSRHLQKLEAELGLPLFQRQGKKMLALTPQGARVLQHANRVVAEFEALKRIGQEERDPRGGTLSLATTHTQSNYLLPDVVCAIRAKYPKARFNIHQSMPRQITEMVVSGVCNMGIATESIREHPELVALPIYRWNRLLICPPDHPLTEVPEITLALLVEYPLITYVPSMTGRWQMDEAFREAGLTPQVVLSANDSDTIKSYVKERMGIGILAEMAWVSNDESHFVARDLSHLFPDNVSRVALRRAYLPSQIDLDFLVLLLPYWHEQQVREVLAMPTHTQRRHLDELERSMQAGNLEMLK